jgi:hypothetical protein
VLFWNAEMVSLSVALGSSVQCLEKRRMYSCRLSPAAACSFAAPTTCRDGCTCLGSSQRRPNADLVVGQVLEPCLRGIHEVERQVLDDEEVVCRPPRGRKPVVLEPHAGVGVLVIPADIGRSSETRGEPHTPHALVKSSRTPLVQRLAAATVVVAVIASSAPSVVVVA